MLESAGHVTTLQDYDFNSGSFPEHISLALASADRFIAMLSPHYVDKPFTQAELHAAYARDPLHLIIPIRVMPCTVPDLIKHIVRIDFVGKNEAQRKQALLDALPRHAAPVLRTSVQKLPTVDPHVFGREAQFDWLEEAWSNPKTNFVQIIAPGGAGKTAVMTKWYRRHLNDVTVFGWSFYSQGTSEKSQTSSDPFFAEALPWFGIKVPATESIFTKVDLLVARLRRERVLLILDGIEPLQDPGGELRDLALRAVLQELAARNPGLVLITTRVRLSDIPDDEPQSLSLDLENLDPIDGARYLAHLGVRGTEDELRAGSEAYENHALALTLLGTYLVTFCGTDIRRRTEISELQVDETKPGRHARKVMASYARTYGGRPEVKILRALGYFDRPAEPEALKLVLPSMENRKYLAALRNLGHARLVLTSDPAQPLDCHPLVREHFAAKATRGGHARLYDYYSKQAPHLPETIEEMTPLFYAVYHGCQAQRHQEVVQDVYFSRILRGDNCYLWSKFGAFGTDLSLLANFFTAPWTRPAAGLWQISQSSVACEAGLALRALGRLSDALAPMRTGAEGFSRLDSHHAATAYSNLSELHLILGNLCEAISAAQQSLQLADRAGDWFSRVSSTATLASTLHQAGDYAQATRLFVEAERLQAESQLEFRLLYALLGYQYCDLLLEQSQEAEVLRRASRTLRWAETESLSLLTIGLDHLLLGRANTVASTEAAHHLDQAVTFIRRAGTLHHLPRALLARGTPDDLEEVFRLATRSGMRLYLTDYHLSSCRLAISNNDPTKAREHFEKAEAFINETGYHRRDAELAQLRGKMPKP